VKDRGSGYCPALHKECVSGVVSPLSQAWPGLLSTLAPCWPLQPSPSPHRQPSSAKWIFQAHASGGVGARQEGPTGMGNSPGMGPWHWDVGCLGRNRSPGPSPGTSLQLCWDGCSGRTDDMQGITTLFLFFLHSCLYYLSVSHFKRLSILSPSGFLPVPPRLCLCVPPSPLSSLSRPAVRGG